MYQFFKSVPNCTNFQNVPTFLVYLQSVTKYLCQLWILRFPFFTSTFLSHSGHPSPHNQCCGARQCWSVLRGLFLAHQHWLWGEGPAVTAFSHIDKDFCHWLSEKRKNDVCISWQWTLIVPVLGYCVHIFVGMRMCRYPFLGICGSQRGDKWLKMAQNVQTWPKLTIFSKELLIFPFHFSESR